MVVWITYGTLGKGRRVTPRDQWIAVIIVIIYDNIRGGGLVISGIALFLFYFIIAWSVLYEPVLALLGRATIRVKRARILTERKEK